MIEELFDNHAEALKRFAISKTRDEDLADEAVQVTFFKAASNLALLQVLTPPKRRAWLFTVLKNCITDHYRMLRFETGDEVEFESGELFTADMQCDAYKMVSELPKSLQDVVILRYWMGMTCAEISRFQSIPAGTVRFQLHRSLTILRDRYGLTAGE